MTTDWTEVRKTILPENSKSALPPSIKLPILPQALQEFQQKAQNPEADTGKLSRIISTDSGLSSELLRHVNSSGTGMRIKVTSVQQALVLLGIRSTLLYLTTSGVKQAMKSSSSKLINFQNFWNTNLERALFAREIAKLMKADAELAFTAGMLQDFLLPLLTNQLLDNYLEFSENREQHTNLAEFERHKLGWDHAEAAAQVMFAWHFPDELICCVGLHHRGLEILDDENLRNTSAAAVAVSSLMPDALRQESKGIERLVELEKDWKEFRLMPLAEKIEGEFQSMATRAKNHFSFLRVCRQTLKRLKAES